MEENESGGNAPIRLDYLIVGHGIAGCLLAAALEHHGVRVGVIDAAMPNAASPVSAGIVNPVIGPKLNPPWQARACLELAARTYRRLETIHRSSFYGSMPILRIFDSQEMLTRWKEKRKLESERESEEAPDDGFFGPILSPERLQSEYSADGPHGAGVIQGGGCLNVKALLASSRKHFERKERFFKQAFHYDDLGKEGDATTWRNLIIHKVVFCEGFRLRDNPWFSPLPFAPSRGDVLKLGPLPSDTCLNAGYWILPQDEETSLAGATYEHNDPEAPPSPEAESVIRNGLNFLEKVPETIERLCGVRPTTTDRMPLIGPHPSEPTLALFNGFGSKASLLAPFCAELMANHLVLDAPLPKELDLRRFPSAANLPGLE